MKRLFKFKYPKLFFLFVCIIIAYLLFSYPDVYRFFSNLGKLSYFGIFIAGMLFAFGFSAPFAVGFFIALNPSNIIFASLLGGLGAVVSDLLIFNFTKVSFEDEFKKLRNSNTSKKLNKVAEETLGKRFKIYLMYIFAGILIASPLPDEAGVIMLAGLTKINQKTLAILGFLLNALGIFIILNL